MQRCLLCRRDSAVGSIGVVVAVVGVNEPRVTTVAPTVGGSRQEKVPAQHARIQLAHRIHLTVFCLLNECLFTGWSLSSFDLLRVISYLVKIYIQYITGEMD